MPHLLLQVPTDRLPLLLLHELHSHAPLPVLLNILITMFSNQLRVLYKLVADLINAFRPLLHKVLPRLLDFFLDLFPDLLGLLLHLRGIFDFLQRFLEELPVLEQS